MIIELNNDQINFNSSKIDMNSARNIGIEDFIFLYDNHEYKKITKDIIYNDFLENIFLFDHNLRNFNIKQDNLTIFYTKTSQNEPWKITLYNPTTHEETSLLYDDDETKNLYEKHQINEESIDIFYKYLGDVSFTKKNEEINFKIIRDNFINDLEEMYNENFEEIIIFQYALKNNFKHMVVEDFEGKLIVDGMKLDVFHKYVFENTNMFKKFKKVETAIQELFLKKTLSIELSSLKKHNSLFNSKIPMPGLYLYKYMVNYLKLLNEKSIPARVLKKRGRKPKNPQPEENNEQEASGEDND